MFISVTNFKISQPKGRNPSIMEIQIRKVFKGGKVDNTDDAHSESPP